MAAKERNMNIAADHMYHGAALIQIAEHPQFTSINSLKVKSEVVRNTFEINDGIGIHLKYASKPNGKYEEYAFTFTSDHLGRVDKVTHKLFLGLVCVEGKHICALPYPDFAELIERRRNDKKANEDQYTLLLTLPKDSAFRVYVSPAGNKGKILGNPLKIARNRFPSALFAGNE
jgi:hypothetical protein